MVVKENRYLWIIVSFCSDWVILVRQKVNKTLMMPQSSKGHCTVLCVIEKDNSSALISTLLIEKVEQIFLQNVSTKTYPLIKNFNFNI